MTNSPVPYFWLYHTAFALQMPAVLLFVGYAFNPKRIWAIFATGLLTASLLVHCVFTLIIALKLGRLPLTNGFEAVSAWGLILTALVVEVEWRHKLGLLGAFLAPLSAATLLMGFRFAQSSAQSSQGLGDVWLLVHVALAMAGYALFTAAAGVAGAYLVQDRQLKAKRMGALFYALPPLRELESLLARLAAIGMVTLALAVGAGFVWRWRLGLPLLSDDPKVGFGLAMVAAYALGLAARAQGPLRGRRFAWLCVALFLVLFFGVYLVNLYFGGHAFLRPGGT